jgi:ligand-binding sensor domain-containing protein
VKGEELINIYKFERGVSMQKIWIFVLAFVLLSIDNGNLHAQWSLAGTVNGELVYSLISDGARLLVGTSSGIFSTTDDGTNWETVSPDIGAEALVVFGTQLFAGTYSGGVFRSTDDGTHWAKVNNGLSTSRILSFAVRGTNIFAGTDVGVFLSTNNGEYWLAASSGLPIDMIEALAVCPDGSGKLFAGTHDHGIFLSTNKGTSWVAVNAGLASSSIRCLVFNGKNLYTGTGAGLFLSSNDGTSWVTVDKSLLGLSASSMAACGSNIIVGWTDVFLSTNNGTNWSDVSTGLPNGGITAVAIHNYMLYAGSGCGGIWKRPLAELTETELRTDELPSQFALHQNYPNPFNPTTTITFSIPHNGFVSLKIFSALGVPVSTLVCEELTSGSYSARWDASCFPSGVYLYRLESGSFSESRKLVLVR